MTSSKLNKNPPLYIQAHHTLLQNANKTDMQEQKGINKIKAYSLKYLTVNENRRLLFHNSATNFQKINSMYFNKAETEKENPQKIKVNFENLEHQLHKNYCSIDLKNLRIKNSENINYLEGNITNHNCVKMSLEKAKKNSDTARIYNILKNYIKKFTHKKSNSTQLSIEFFEDLLKCIFDDKTKVQLKLYLKEMFENSAKFINLPNLDSSKLKALIERYTLASEMFTNTMLFHIKKNENFSEENKQDFKDILLTTIIFAGMLVSYEKRKSKFGIWMRRAFIPIAFVFGSLLGNTISQFLTTGMVITYIASISSVFPPLFCTVLGTIIFYLAGAVAGYLLNIILEKFFNFIYERSLHKIQTQTENTIQSRLKKFKINLISPIYSNLGEKNNNQNNTKNAEIKISRNFVKKLIKLNNDKENLSIKKEKIKEYLDFKINLIKAINKEELIGESLLLLHYIVNCSEYINPDFIKVYWNRINEIIKILEIEKKHFQAFLESLCILVFNYRPLSTSSLRNSFNGIYFLTDIGVDVLGILGSTSETSSFLSSLGVNMGFGLIAVLVGTFSFLTSKALAASKDKKEVLIPNIYINSLCYKYLKKHQNKLKLTINFNTNFLHYRNNTEQMDNQPTTITKNQHFIIQGKQNTIFNYLNNKIGEKESKIVIYKVLSKKDDVYEIECKKLTSLDDSINNGFIPFHALNIGIEMLKKQIQDTEFMIQELLSRQFSSTTNTSFPTESGLFSDYQIRAIAS